MSGTLVDRTLVGLCTYLTDILFREVVVINETAIPHRGPLLVYGNHNNQFVDGMLMKRICPRYINFITAAVSIRRPIIGPLLRAGGAIPLERAMDLAKKGPGVITRVTGDRVFGSDTLFTRIEQGSTLDFQMMEGEIRIKEVISDTELIVDKPPTGEYTYPLKYRIVPKMDYHEVYDEVWKKLGKGSCVGIFPEGGSHDRMQIIPLKAGICIFALGAMEKYGTPVTLLSCGFNYFNPQNYRSKVIVEFGVPYTVPLQMLELYKVNRKEAISSLLKEIENRLLAVTTHSHNFNNLSWIFTLRELYMLEAKEKYSEKEKIEINRRFLKGCDKLTAIDSPEVAQMVVDVSKFDAFVRNNGLKVTSPLEEHPVLYDLVVLVFYLVKSINRLLLTLPGLILLYPSIQYITKKAEEQRIQCVRSSKVKVQGNDVVGSSKLRLSMVVLPITFLVYSLAAFWLMTGLTEWKLSTRTIISTLAFVLFPFYINVMLPSLDTLAHTWKKLKYLFLRLFKRDSCKMFNRERISLAERVRETVKNNVQKVFPDFDKIRIVSLRELDQSQRLLDTHSEQLKSPRKSKNIERIG